MILVKIFIFSLVFGKTYKNPKNPWGSTAKIHAAMAEQIAINTYNTYIFTESLRNILKQIFLLLLGLLTNLHVLVHRREHSSAISAPFFPSIRKRFRLLQYDATVLRIVHPPQVRKEIVPPVFGLPDADKLLAQKFNKIPIENKFLMCYIGLVFGIII